MCVDYRRLNQLIIGDALYILRTDKILDHLRRSRYYSTLDLASGYHYVPIKPENRQKTAFSIFIKISHIFRTSYNGLRCKTLPREI